MDRRWMLQDDPGNLQTHKVDDGDIHWLRLTPCQARITVELKSHVSRCDPLWRRAIVSMAVDYYD